VLYVSKASVVSAHRDKLAELAKHVEVTLLVPKRWGRAASEPGRERQPGELPPGARYAVERLPVIFRGRNHLHLYRGLGSVLTRGAFDLVHVDEEPYSLVTRQVGARAGALGIPWLFFAWQNIDKRLPLPFRELRGRVFREAAGGIAGSEEAASVLRIRGFEGPLAVIPQMGVDPEVFRPDTSARRDAREEVGVPEGAFLAGYVGRLVPEKGVDLLVDAIPHVPGAHALIVGGGPRRRALERRASAAAAEARVHFAGDVPSLDVPRWIAALDCLVLPSRTTRRWKEQFGRVLVEAMATGVPVVGSSSGEIPSVIGDAGRIFVEGDGRALIGELRALAESRELRAELARRGRERALARYTQEKIVLDTVTFYERIAPSSSWPASGAPTLPGGVLRRGADTVREAS
jgi:glycosyltransferase involved in cell wall biosynthesis